MEIFLGILIPFIGTTLGAACVFFMKKIASKVKKRYTIRVHSEEVCTMERRSMRKFYK